MLAFILPVNSIAQEDTFHNFTFGGPGDEETGVLSSDHYKFGSVKVELSTARNNYEKGEVLTVRGNLRNTNDYPIIDGGVYVRIFRTNSAYKTKAGNDLVDEFFAIENITLNANSNRLVSFEWNIPEEISGGRYLVAMDYVINRNFYLSGSPILEGVYGGVSYFNLDGGAGNEVVFNKENIFVNNTKAYARDFIPSIDRGEDVSINYQLNNLSADTQNITVLEKLYDWDGLKEDNLIKTNTDNVELNGKGTLDRSVDFSNLDPGTYLLKVTTESEQGVPATLNVRFSITGGPAPTRINFQKLQSFPLKEGEPNAIFSSFHSVFYGLAEDYSVRLTLTDDNGNSISEANYSGNIQSGVTAIMDEFTPNRDYNSISLTTTVYDENNNVVNETKSEYTPEKFANMFSVLSARVENNEIVISPNDFLGNVVDAEYALEIRDQDGKNIFFEPSLLGEFRKNIDEAGLDINQSYNLVALTRDDNTKVTAENVNLSDAQDTDDNNIIIYVLLFVAVIVLLVIAKKLLTKRSE